MVDWGSRLYRFSISVKDHDGAYRTVERTHTKLSRIIERERKDGSPGADCDVEGSFIRHGEILAKAVAQDVFHTPNVHLTFTSSPQYSTITL